MKITANIELESGASYKPYITLSMVGIHCVDEMVEFLNILQVAGGFVGQKVIMERENDQAD